MAKEFLDSRLSAGRQAYAGMTKKKATRNDKSVFMKLKPLHDHLVVKPITQDEITKAGIVLPDTMDKEKPEKGEVVAVGQGKMLDNGQVAPMSVKIGDKVMFKKYSPDEIKVDGVEYLIISEGDILAVLE